MADASDRDKWQHTTYLAATILNSQRSASSPLVTPDQLDPYSAKKKPVTSPNQFLRARELGAILGAK
jgi:hypothetical protein